MGEKPLGIRIAFATENFLPVNSEPVEKVFLLALVFPGTPKRTTLAKAA
jgi:hypothetical protein